MHVDGNEVLIVDVPNYFAQLGLILQSTSKRAIANYFGWRTVHFGSGLLNAALLQRRMQFLETTIGLRKQDARYNECVTLTTK